MMYTYRGLSLSDPAYYAELRHRAEYNRNHPTEAERILWLHISSKRLNGFKFRRQHVIDHFIVDFICLSMKLIVEIDGGYHFTPEQQFDDTMRTARLNELGYTVIRFTNEEILNNIAEVLQQIQYSLTFH